MLENELDAALSRGRYERRLPSGDRERAGVGHQHGHRERMRSAYDETLAMALKRKHEPQRFVGDLLKGETDRSSPAGRARNRSRRGGPGRTGDADRIPSRHGSTCVRETATDARPRPKSQSRAWAAMSSREAVSAPPVANDSFTIDPWLFTVPQR